MSTLPSPTRGFWVNWSGIGTWCMYCKISVPIFYTVDEGEYFSRKREKFERAWTLPLGIAWFQSHLDFSLRLVVTQGKELKCSMSQFLHLSCQCSRSVGKTDTGYCHAVDKVAHRVLHVSALLTFVYHILILILKLMQTAGKQAAFTLHCWKWTTQRTLKYQL